MKKIILLIILIITTADFLIAVESGRSLMMLGESAESLGRGGASVTSEGVDLFFGNPASVSYLERTSFSIQYGNLNPEYYSPEFSAAQPTSYGNIAAGLRYMNIGDSVDIQTAYYGSVAAAKPFSDNLDAGLSINLMYGSEEEGALLYIGGGIGFIYKIPFVKTTKAGFGLYNPRIAFALNAGIPFDDDTSSANLNSITLGYSFDFFKNKTVLFGFYNEVTAINYYEAFPVKAGLETVIWDSFSIRVGGIFPDEYEYADFTAGLGYKYNHEKFSAEVNYSLVHKSGTEFVHYIGVTSEIGELDRTPPITVVKPDEKNISPNYDGNQDYVKIDLDVTDRSRIRGWSLRINDENGKLVREYKVSEREINKTLTPVEFMKKIFSKKESMVVPETILWDGANSEGKIVEDGKYTYSFIAWDERDNYSMKKDGTIKVDNNSPEVKLKTDYVLFSPNGDDSKDELVIKQDFKSEQSDKWTAGFKNAKGEVVKTFNWNGNDLPQEVVWNGKDDSGKDVPEGLYTYFIECSDEAGNSDNKMIKEITLTRQYQTVDVKTNKKYISQKSSKEVNFKIDLSDKNGLSNWKIDIINDDEVIKSITGTNEIPDFVKWDFTDSDGKKVEDGEYFYTIAAVFESGNKPKSFKKKFIIDSTDPEIDLKFNPDLFSPDDDGENDILTIEPDSEDEFGVAKWEIVITNPTGFEFKKFSGEGNPPKDIKWDGIGDNKELVESATDYSISYEVVDNAGNKSIKKNIKLPVDVLVVVTERGLKIKITNIEFAFGSAKIIGNGKKILKRVSQILDKYETYDVVVEGHTDDLGKEDYNLRLSESRARAVYNYLIQNGVDKERLTFRGMGETMPYVENLDNESRRKNRRVEFILIKPGEKTSEKESDVKEDDQ